MDALRRLADAWRSAATIGREVASDLHVINQVTRNMLHLAGEGLWADATLGGDPA